MLRKIIRRGFKIRNREDSEENVSHVFSNNDILLICKTEGIVSHVSKQQFRYLAYIARRSNSDIAKRLLFNDDRNRERGRQLKTMEQHVL